MSRNRPRSATCTRPGRKPASTASTATAWRRPALFAALSELVNTYGEDATAKFATGLSERIANGEFSLEFVAAIVASGSGLTLKCRRGYPQRTQRMGVWRMRTGISFSLKPADCRRSEGARAGPQQRRTSMSGGRRSFW